MASTYPRLRHPRCWTALAFALALASCAPSRPAPPVASAPAPPPPPPAHVARPQLHPSWSFRTAAESCVAQARAPGASLSVAIQATGPIRLTLSLAADLPEHPIARFAGTAGSWDVGPGAIWRRTAVFTLARTETSLSRILVLLSGGHFGLQETDGPILVLPESGPAGRHWFACARRSVNGA